MSPGPCRCARTPTPALDTIRGTTASVDGGATTTPDQIHIDTTTPGTHTILYTATDQSGETATSTRTVIVQSATSTASAQ